MTKKRGQSSGIRLDDAWRSAFKRDGMRYSRRNDAEEPGGRIHSSNHQSGEGDSDLEDWEAAISPDDDVLDGNILMVDQLWLWVIDTTTLVTFFPSREGDPMEGPLYQQADLRDSIFNEVNAVHTQRCDNASDLAALSVLHAVSVLIDRSSHPNLQIFRIFEEAISILTEKATSSLKRFRTSDLKRRYGDNDIDLKTSSIRELHRQEEERSEREHQDNILALLELRDIEDELSTMKHLFEEQEEQINTMHLMYSSDSNYDALASGLNLPAEWIESQRRASLAATPSALTDNGKAYLLEALVKLKSYRTQVDDMLKRVQKTRCDFNDLLEMVQRQAQINEVRLSRLLARAQNRSVMIFTIFTVLFLPLSFFTSLFGMNTHEWGGGTNLHLYTIGSIALPASAFLITFALVVAWSSSVRMALRNLKRSVRVFKDRMKWRIVALLCGEDEVDVRMRQKRRAAVSEKRPRSDISAHDFWERNREVMNSKYDIPQQNRRWA